AYQLQIPAEGLAVVEHVEGRRHQDPEPTHILAEGFDLLHDRIRGPDQPALACKILCIYLVLRDTRCKGPEQSELLVERQGPVIEDRPDGLARGELHGLLVGVRDKDHLENAPDLAIGGQPGTGGAFAIGLPMTVQIFDSDVEAQGYEALAAGLADAA